MESQTRKNAALLALLSAGLALFATVHALGAVWIDLLAFEIALVLMAVLLAGSAGAVLAKVVRAQEGKPNRS